jgi:hypothetical protein
MGLKRHFPDIRFSGNKVTADELGYDLIYTVMNPSISATWFGTCAGTSTQSIALGVINDQADYARNVILVVSCASGSTKGGTAIVNGKDQFGNNITENLVVTVAANGGTTIGTKVFERVSSGTFNFGTANAGNGTATIGNGTAGTTTIFGFPFKLGGTEDIKNITGSFAGVGTSTAGTFVFGGTPASSADLTNHAFKAPLDLQAGTCVYRVRVRPSYEDEGLVAL